MRIGLSVALVAAVLVLAVRLFADRLIFFPRRDGDWDAARRAPYPIEAVTLIAADGVRLFCWYLRVPEARCTVLVFHGNAGNIADRLDEVVSLGRLGVDVLIVGYRGYGRSEGSPSEAGVYRDAEAAYRFLVEERGVSPARLVVLGESLGSAPAIELAARRPVAGVIIQSAFTSVRDMAAHVLPLVPIHLVMVSKFDNLEKIRSVKAPKLFFATRADEVVPYAQTRRLYEAAPEPRRWVEFDDCGHNELYALHEREWSRAIAEFIADLP